MLDSDGDIVALIPAFEAAPSIGDVVREVSGFVPSVLVVDDGSTDETAQRAADSGAHVVSHDENQGKGVALKTGFERLLGEDVHLVVTLDADGQHRPQHIPDFIEMHRRTSAALVVGCRSTDAIPGIRSFGNRFSNFWLRLATPYDDLTDTQSGYRLYDLRQIPDEVLLAGGSGFEYETEVILSLADLGLDVVPVTIETVYDTYPEVPSHFSAWRDVTRIIFTYLRHILFRRRS